MSAPHIILASLPSFCQKLSELVKIWRSYNKSNFAWFFETRCTRTRCFCTDAGNGTVPGAVTPGVKPGPVPVDPTRARPGPIPSLTTARGKPATYACLKRLIWCDRATVYRVIFRQYIRSSQSFMHTSTHSSYTTKPCYGKENRAMPL